MPAQESAFQNLVLFFLNDIYSTNKEVLKIQSKQLALLEAIKDNLYAPNVEAVNEVINQLQEVYFKTSEISINNFRDLMQKEVVLPNLAS